jgi:hypothetical protein
MPVATLARGMDVPKLSLGANWIFLCHFTHTGEWTLVNVCVFALGGPSPHCVLPSMPNYRGHGN